MECPRFDIVSGRLGKLGMIKDKSTPLSLTDHQVNRFSCFRFPLSFPLRFRYGYVHRYVISVVKVPLEFDCRRHLIFLSVEKSGTVIRSCPHEKSKFKNGSDQDEKQTVLSIHGAPLLPPLFLPASSPTARTKNPVGPQMLPATCLAVRFSFSVSVLFSLRRGEGKSGSTQR